MIGRFTTEEEEEKESRVDGIKVEGNKIYFYCEVTRQTIMLFTNEVIKLENTLIKMKEEYDLKEYPSINIYIHSDGGDAIAGLSAMDMLKERKVPIITICDGFVASAATFILLGGGHIKMRQHSYVLIHQIKTEFWGKYNDLCDELKNCENLMRLVQKIYKDNSKIPTKKLQTIINKELYMDALECEKLKLIHEIIQFQKKIK